MHNKLIGLIFVGILSAGSGLAAEVFVTIAPPRVVVEKLVLARLGDGTAYGAPVGLFYYHLRCSEIDQAAGWAEKAIEQGGAAILSALRTPGAEGLRRSARWPKLAKMMNLPESVS